MASVIERPTTRYTKRGDVHIAYQVFGSGPADLLLFPDWISHVEAAWEHPTFSSSLERLASFSRVIWFDKRGTGLSDPVPVVGVAGLEQWADDARTVLDAVGCDRAALVGVGHGGTTSAFLAATSPDRISGLVLVNAFARTARAPDFHEGMPPRIRAAVIRGIETGWGTGVFHDVMMPGRDDEFRDWFGRYQRLCASPGTAAALAQSFFDTDVRSIAPTIPVPTLVLQRRDALWARAGQGRYFATHVPDARYVELEGREHYFRDGDDPFLDVIQEFVTGMPPVHEPDRVLATVLFTDIVSSTEQLAEVGDRRWRAQLDDFRARVRRELERYRGREVGTRGDDFLAIFDGPARAVRCAHAIGESARPLGIRVRSGLHTGELEVADDDVAGIAVHIGARVAALAGPGDVLVSRTVVDLVGGAGLDFDDRGSHTLKGVPGEWQVFALRP
jgi:class 3 adenylate cyclase/pimeloyl-ACP methyl ester carboxylesterase